MKTVALHRTQTFQAQLVGNITIHTVRAFKIDAAIQKNPSLEIKETRFMNVILISTL